MDKALNSQTTHGPARASVIRCKDVTIKTGLILFRVRNIIAEKKSGQQLVAEEMIIWGYQGNPNDHIILETDEINRLIHEALPSANLSPQAQADFLENELNILNDMQKDFDQIALKRANVLIDAHERFQKVVGGNKFKVVEPVLPMDLMGIYIFLPDNNSS